MSSVFSASVTVVRMVLAPSASSTFVAGGSAREEVAASSATVTFESFTYSYAVVQTMRPVATFSEVSVTAGIVEVPRQAGIVEIGREATIV
jgi:hypothetical protein